MTSCLVFCLLLVFELSGFPENITLGIKQNLKAQGLNINVGEIHAGLINGAIFSQVDILDPEDKEHILIHADSIHLDANRDQLLNGSLYLEKLELENAALNLLLKNGNEQKPLQFTNIYLKMARLDNEAIFEKCTCQWNNILLSVKGKITALPQQSSDQPMPNTDFSKLSLNYFNETFSPELKLKILEIIDGLEKLSFQGKIIVDANFEVNLKKPQNNYLNLSLIVPKFTYKNIPMEGTVLLQVKGGKIHLKDIRWKINKNEFIRGNLNVNIKDNLINGELSGRAYLARLIKIQFPELQHIKAKGTPPSFSFKLKDSLLDTPYAWNINGHVSLVNTYYKNLKFNNLSAKVNYSNNLLNLENIKFSTPRLRGNSKLMLDIENKSLTLEGDFIGDPYEIHHFIKGDIIAKGFQEIWSDFSWEDSALPNFSGKLTIANFHKKDPIIKVLANSTAAGFSFRGVKIQKASTEVQVDIPGKIQLTNTNASFTNGNAKLNITFSEERRGLDRHISINGTSSTNIRTLLSLVSHEWKTILPFLTFPQNSKTEIDCVIYPNKVNSTKLTAKIALPGLKCFNFYLENINSTLHYRDSHLTYDTKQVDFYGGKLDLYYSHDFDEDIRTLSINADKPSLPGVLTRVSKKSLDKIAGVISAKLDLKILPPTKNSKAPFSLTGKGTLSIIDGNFWKVPLLSEFMSSIDSMLPINASGRIQELHSDLIFKENVIEVPKFFSDGSILALSGNGNYNWADNSFLFLVNTHYLKSALTLPKPLDLDLLSPIFAPISTVMKGRLSGNLEDYKWELENIRKIKDFFKKIPNALLYPFKLLFD